MAESPEYHAAAQEVASILDFAVSSLGAELDALFGQLLEMGLKHDKFPRLRDDHWNRMEKALLGALEETIDLDASTRAAWSSVFGQIASEMTAVLKPMRRRSWDASTVSSDCSSIHG